MIDNIYLCRAVKENIVIISISTHLRLLVEHSAILPTHYIYLLISRAHLAVFVNNEGYNRSLRLAKMSLITIMPIFIPDGLRRRALFHGLHFLSKSDKSYP